MSEKVKNFLQGLFTRVARIAFATLVCTVFTAAICKHYQVRAPGWENCLYGLLILQYAGEALRNWPSDKPIRSDSN